MCIFQIQYIVALKKASFGPLCIAPVQEDWLCLICNGPYRIVVGVVWHGLSQILFFIYFLQFSYRCNQIHRLSIVYKRWMMSCKLLPSFWLSWYESISLCRIAKGVVEGLSHNLLESVAQSIANSTLVKFPQISAIRVKVGKPHVAVQGVVDYLGVEILRYRKAWEAPDMRKPEQCSLRILVELIYV